MKLRHAKALAIAFLMVGFLGYVLIYCKVISEQFRRDVINEYIDRVKYQISLTKPTTGEKLDFVVVSSLFTWTPINLEKESVCPDANDIVLQARKSGGNFIITGNASEYSLDISVNGVPLVIVVADLEIFPRDVVPATVTFDLKYKNFLSQGSEVVSIDWMACEKAMIAIPTVYMK